MSWDTITGTSGGRYVQFVQNQRMRIRLLLAEDIDGISPEPFTIWYHRIFQVNDGSKVIRPYSTEVCQYETDSRGVCRCGLCGQEDPLYDMLSSDDQKVNRDGERDHFPRTSQHLTLVWNYETNRIEILKQGTSLYKKFIAIKHARGHLNCDIMIWKQVEGKGGKTGTTYEAQALDSSDFDKGLIDIDELPVLTASENPTPWEQLNLLISGQAESMRKLNGGSMTTKKLPDPTVTAAVSSKLANLKKSRESNVIDVEVVESSDVDDLPDDLVSLLKMKCTEGTKYPNKSLQSIVDVKDIKYFKFMAKNAKDKSIATLFQKCLDLGVADIISGDVATVDTGESLKSVKDEVLQMIESDEALNDGTLLAKVMQAASNEAWDDDTRFDIEAWIDADGGDKAIRKLHSLLSSRDYDNL